MIWFPEDARLESGYLVDDLPRAPHVVYSHELALFAALCASTAYEREDDGRRMFEIAGFDDVGFIERGDTQAYLAVAPAETAPIVVVSFRGTDSIRDFMADARFGRRRLRGWRGLWVHRGFDGALDLVWDEIVRFISDVGRTRGTPAIYFMGHSLGGALALLAAHRLSRHRSLGTTAGIVTLGGPRVGNALLAEAIERVAPVHRVVHASDAVPRVPPLLFGYRHAGSEHWLLADGSELTMWDDARPSIAKRLRWLQAVYEQSYGFRQYVLLSLIAALLATTATYKGLGLYLSVAQALALAALYWALLLFLVTDLVPSLPAGMQRWFRPHAVIDHGAGLYVKDLAGRLGRQPSPRPQREDGG